MNLFPRFLTGRLRSLGALAVAGSLAWTSACGGPLDPPRERVESAEESATTSSALTAQQLADDADFQHLYLLASRTGANSLLTGRTFTPAQRAALAVQLQSTNSAVQANALHVLGITDQEIATQRQLAAMIALRYDLAHNPLAATIVRGATQNYAARLADPNGGPAQNDPLQDLIEQTGSGSSGGSSGGSGGSGGNGTGCEDLCAVQFAAGAALALTDYIVALVGCQALGPFGIICAAGATAAYAYQLYLLDKANDTCIAKCD